MMGQGGGSPGCISSTASTARKIGSGFITIPPPPPYGVSSHCRCFPGAQSRMLWMAMVARRDSMARLMMLSSKGPLNMPGNRVKRSMCIRPAEWLFPRVKPQTWPCLCPWERWQPPLRFDYDSESLADRGALPSQTSDFAPQSGVFRAIVWAAHRRPGIGSHL